MKDPAFLFYPNDYIGGTMGMTFEQKGAYIELLMTQFNRGHMTTHMIGQVLGQGNGQIWDMIKDKFIQDDEGKFYNVRLEIEQNKRKQFTDSRKNNRNGKNQYTKEGNHADGHTTKHMENRNRNEDLIDFDSIDTTLITKDKKFDYSILKQNTQKIETWYRITVTNNNLPVKYDKFVSLLNSFCDTQESTEYQYKNEIEYADHFVKWVAIQVKKPENQKARRMMP
jgi:uncharacterized protein YdaU (DUF1376 family)